MLKNMENLNNRTCGDCRYFTDGCRCSARDEQITSSILFDEGCPHFEELKQTVFDYITQSEEKLAECSVCKLDSGVYYSHITGGFYVTENKAIEATVEELKKEVKNG